MTSFIMLKGSCVKQKLLTSS